MHINYGGNVVYIGILKTRPLVWYGMVSWDLSALPKMATRVTLKTIADGT